MLYLFPALFADPRRPLSSVIYASDLSRIGGRVLFGSLDDYGPGGFLRFR